MSSFAISNEKLVQALKVNPGDVWFCAVTTGDEEMIGQLTQKPAFGDCF